MGRRRGFLAELERQAAVSARERQRAQAAAVRQHAAAIREAERAHRAAQRAATQAARADARAAAEAEKARKQAYLEARLADVDAQNAALRSQIEEIDRLLADTLQRDDHIDLRTLRRRVEHPPFDPGTDGRPAPIPSLPRLPPEPRWGQYEPAAPTGLAKAFGGRTRHERAVEEARSRFSDAQAKWQQTCRQMQHQHSRAVQEHRHAEQQRLQRFEQAKQRYQQECHRRQQAVEQHNHEIDTFADALNRRDPTAVVDYFGMVLSRSVYPDSFPQTHRIAYVPESAQLVVEYGLPTIDAVPAIKEYRYIKARDEITTSTRPVKDVRAQYGSLVAQVSLRTVHEIFEADRDGFIETVVFNGIVSTTDPATGQPVTPCIVTLRTTRDVFQGLDLSAVEATACLTHLNAGVSKRPDELAPIRPVLEFDMVDKRFVEESDVLSGLDQRPNLLELTPTEFESPYRTCSPAWASTPNRPAPHATAASTASPSTTAPSSAARSSSKPSATATPSTSPPSETSSAPSRTKAPPKASSSLPPATAKLVTSSRLANPSSCSTARTYSHYLPNTHNSKRESSIQDNW